MSYTLIYEIHIKLSTPSVFGYSIYFFIFKNI